MRNHQTNTYQVNNGYNIPQMPSDVVVVAKTMMPKCVSMKKGK